MLIDSSNLLANSYPQIAQTRPLRKLVSWNTPHEFEKLNPREKVIKPVNDCEIKQLNKTKDEAERIQNQKHKKIMMNPDFKRSFQKENNLIFSIEEKPDEEDELHEVLEDRNFETFDIQDNFVDEELNTEQYYSATDLSFTASSNSLDSINKHN